MRPPTRFSRAPLGALAVLLLLVLAACGQSTDSEASGGTASGSAASAPESDAGGDAGATTADDAGGSYTVAHQAGETELPDVPSRVVVLDNAMQGDVSAFDDVTIVGTAAGSSDPTVLPPWEDDVSADVEVVAPDFTPDLEAVAAVRPDANLAMAWQTEEDYWDELRQIAPTVAVETDVNPAVEGRFDEVALRTYAELFRQPDVPDALLEEYEARVAEVAEEFGDVIDGRTISFAQRLDDGTVRVDVAAGWAGAILAEIGFTFPEVQTENVEEDFPVRVVFSLEEVERYLGDSDVIIWRTTGVDGDLVQEGFGDTPAADEPLLTGLPAAEAGQVVTVSNDTWFLRSVRGRMVVLDQLAEEVLPLLRE